jgi:hypothetical protein
LCFVAYKPIQFFFGEMTERRVSEVVCKACGFNDVLIQVVEPRKLRLPTHEFLSETTTDLGNLQGVGKPIVKDMPRLTGCNLSDCGKTMEC